MQELERWIGLMLYGYRNVFGFGMEIGGRRAGLLIVALTDDMIDEGVTG
jgi:hypothetical protein